MGSPTKAQTEQFTDQIAACVQKDIDGFIAESSTKTVNSLYDLVDASNDPDVETALASKSYDIDQMSLPEYIRSWLPTITQRDAYAAWARALNSLVTSTAGGSNASLRAYLSSVSAKLHPLAGEVIRKALSNDDIFTSSSVVLGVSNPTYSAIFPTAVYTGADGSLADDLTDATDVGTADVALFAADNDALYVGSNRPFQGLVVALSTASSADIAATFQYWNGSAWTTLTCTDNTAGFTRNDTITWTAPSDWGRWYKDSGGTAFANTARLYYIRIARTENTVVTPPVGTCVTLIPKVITTAVGGTAHMAGIEQPPLALCRITGTNAMSVSMPADIDYTRFAEPVGTENKIRFRALTAIGNDLTVTLTYVNSSAANGSTAQSAWTAPAALGTATVALTSSDALRSIRAGSTISTSATSGVFAVECLSIRSPAV